MSSMGFLAEATKMKQLRHPNLVRLYAKSRMITCAGSRVFQNAAKKHSLRWFCSQYPHELGAKHVSHPR